MATSVNIKTVEIIFECDAASASTWVVEHASLNASLNDLFVLSLQLSTNNLDAEPVQMLGQPAKLTMTRDTVMREITGIVSEVHEGSTHPEMLTTQITD